MIGKQAGSKANKKLLNGAAFQVGRKATKWDLKMTLQGYANLCSVIISLAPDFQTEGFLPEHSEGMELQNQLRAQVRSKPRQGSCRASISGFSVDGLKQQRSYPKSHGQRKAERFPPTVMPRDSAGIAEALETDLLFKEGEGFPGGSFRSETEGFSSKQISLKAHFHRRLRNVWKPKTSDTQSALWHFTGQKSNKKGK